MDYAVRSHLHQPTSAFETLDALRSSVPSAGSFGRQRLQQEPPRRPLHSQLHTGRLPPSSNRLSIAHVTDGLRTPPPEMNAAVALSSSSLSTLPANSYVQGPLKQFEPPTATSGAPKMLESFRNTIPVSSRETPMQRQSSQTGVTQYEQPQPKQRESTSSRNSTPLTVPSSINSTKAPLGDFAAQITCLFWFESTFVLHRVAESPMTESQSPIPLAPHAVPSNGFRKWLTTILSTTQVTTNVILLALLFVYRLKKLNPTVQGNPGSEFRLFTVALMLGNKFLDDNTYTNNTWADVSGISVQEIHIMEVEFLSNMRYSLYVSENEWREWHVKLGKFWEYWDRASRVREVQQQQQQPLALPTHGHLTTMVPSLPSPPPSNSSSPPFGHVHSPSAHTFPPHHLPAPAALNPPHLPYVPMPQPDFDSITRKRSMDYTPMMQPPAKRLVTRASAPKLSVTVPQFPVQVPTAMSATNAQIPRLQPLEYSTIPTTQQPLQSSRPARLAPTLPPAPPLQPQLPLPGARTLSVVYSQPTHSTTSVPSSVGATHNINISPYNPRQQSSPYSQHHSAASSPTTPSYGSQRSPTWILGNRDSPYRPVRAVNTLLFPPHSQAPQPQHIAYDQMHYQPLAKVRSQSKTGVVPYMQPEVTWSHSWLEPQV